MNTTPLLKEIFRRHNIFPRKSLGQNFLVDDDIARHIVDAAHVQPGDIVIEIGPGAGALTRHLASRARHVIAVEIDRNLVPVLQAVLSDCANVTIVQEDALEADFAARVLAIGAAADTPVRFVGNLPYYITSAVIRRMLESGLNAQCIVLTVQLEVAQRIVAQPGEMSLLAVSVQFYGQPELLMKLSPSAFYPQPDVDSAVVRITPAQRNADATAVFTLARAGFAQRRKQMRNTLAVGLQMSKDAADALLVSAGINPERRAETLSMAEWEELAQKWRYA